MKKVLIVSLSLSLVFYSCASTGFLMAKPKVTMYQTAYPPKNENDPIDIYQSQKPDKKYIEIAIITCNDTNDKWNLQQIQKKAREIGADGVILIVKAGSYGVGNSTFMISEDYGITAIVIRYR
jgi:hypothetical protein